MVDLVVVSIVLSSVSTTALGLFAVMKNIQRFKCCLCCESDCKNNTNNNSPMRVAPIIPLHQIIPPPPPSPIHIQSFNNTTSTNSSPRSSPNVQSPRPQRKLPIPNVPSHLHN